jgi:hypothetical protein
MDFPAILRKAKSYTCDEDDYYKIALAVRELYPKAVEECKAMPGYTPELLLEYILDELLDWARLEAPALFRYMQRQRYINGGIDEAYADDLVDGELTAIRKGTYFCARG